MSRKSCALEMILASEEQSLPDGGLTGIASELAEIISASLEDAGESVETWTNRVVFRALDIAGTEDLIRIRTKLVQMGGDILAWVWDIDQRLDSAA